MDSEKFYKYSCEDYSGNNIPIVVKAKSEAEAEEKLSSYDVSRGELHYKHLVSVSNDGKEVYYKDACNALPLAVALMGAQLGMCQVSQYGVCKDYRSCLTKETIDLIKRC